ncbi:alpha/beta hydrolase [Emericellopsis atlantica]|uniref:Alpha/beta hydrolase n=1 Tax=Emericellopsis atlantica TaxID=2614577 RepID=A0A9P7ZS78_9HYPO|nr:alpha/beta hydrolase [Emericellopsis atlantica]KAG9256698.1 alpha/beta hydrolase [Emericellopsis atlantica]
MENYLASLRSLDLGLGRDWTERIFTRPYGLTAVAATVGCLSTYLYIRPALSFTQPLPSSLPAKRYGSRHRKAVEVAAEAEEDEEGPYPEDIFPGGRSVDTPYGTIQVYEWGPENGEQVLLMHGIGTPCVALGNMANRFVDCGCRVMLFDFFGRGYSDTPSDIPFDIRLYTSQILCVLASSPIPWYSFHILGYSLGGAIAAAFAAYFPHRLLSVTLVCPGGLIRPSHISLRSRLLYTKGVLPEGWVKWLIRRRLRPSPGPSADVPVDDTADVSVDFDQVVLSKDTSSLRVGDTMRRQLVSNPGLVDAYISTIRNAPIYGQHDDLWRRLSARLAERRVSREPPPGLPLGRVCLILAENDPVVVKDEWIQDSRHILGEFGVEIHVLPGGHEIAISRGEAVADIAMRSWEEDL